jgi:hypothetical protein
VQACVSIIVSVSASLIAIISVSASFVVIFAVRCDVNQTNYICIHHDMLNHACRAFLYTCVCYNALASVCVCGCVRLSDCCSTSMPASSFIHPSIHPFIHPSIHPSDGVSPPTIHCTLLSTNTRVCTYFQASVTYRAAVPVPLTQCKPASMSGTR